MQEQEDENKYLREEVANLAYTNQKITQSMSYISEQFSKVFETLKFLTARNAPTARPSGPPATGPSGVPSTGPGGAPTGSGGAPTVARPDGAPTTGPSGAPVGARPGGAPTGARPGGAPQPVSAPRAQEPSGSSTQPNLGNPSD